jgi:hypothetical protein
VSKSKGTAVRKPLIAGLAVVLCLAAGIVIGDRYTPFRDTGISSASRCHGILSTVDFGFIPQTTFTGRRIATSDFEESGSGNAYRLDCTIYGDGNEQLQATAGISTYDAAAWQKDLKVQGRLPGELKTLSVTAAEGEEGSDVVGLSAKSSAAYYLPCKLPGGKSVHLSVSVTAPGASDGDEDDQRLTVASIAAKIANHSVLKLICQKPVTVADESPTFAS